jgi:hypothetical protein
MDEKGQGKVDFCIAPYWYAIFQRQFLDSAIKKEFEAISWRPL